MEKLTCYLFWLTIVALNTILFITASSNGLVTVKSAGFNVLVNLMYVALLSSSVLIGYLNWRKKQKMRALLFGANILIVLIPTILTITGFIKLPSSWLIALDLYWLNQYWLYIAGKCVVS